MSSNRISYVCAVAPVTLRRAQLHSAAKRMSYVCAIDPVSVRRAQRAHKRKAQVTIPQEPEASKRKRTVFGTLTNITSRVRLPKRKEPEVDLADESFCCRGGEFL
ncbi:hypothetical protein C8F04DRAFT_1263198 [Mycena alexandri]|uniref:Uncharacterized protein n=1 Tax=Mycena alexandri TaxID=1745969 RepID=A0AAD6SRH0_9AGAR|nr:hypothetical protein C8F04DRAFT_1263198 [Mycena alexandri]